MSAGDAAAQGPALTDQVGLADELVEVSGPHPRRERLALGRWPEQGLGTGARGIAPGGHEPMVSPRRCGGTAR